MKYINNLYLDKNIDEFKANKIIVGLECGEYPAYYYLACFKEKDDYLEILSYRALKIEIKMGNKPIIVGIASNEKSARELIIKISEEMFNLHFRVNKSDLIEDII